MQRYLLGDTLGADQLKQHLFLWTQVEEVSADLSGFGINTLIRHTAMHDLVINPNGRGAAVIYNHGGCMYALLVQGNPRDVWERTKVSPKGGKIRPPQKLVGWVRQAFEQGT